MITKHFLKALIVFTGLIFVGLLGVFVVSYLEEENTEENTIYSSSPDGFVE